MVKPSKKKTVTPKFADAGYRLRAARLAAGYIFVVDAAMVLSISIVMYRGLEGGNRRFSEKLNTAASTAFGVSETFLNSGVSSDGTNDGLAVELVAVIRAMDDVDESRGESLRRMRNDAGFESASAAAREHKWKVATFLGHESGVYPIPVDRMIGYALAFGFEPHAALPGRAAVIRAPDIVWSERERVPPKAIETKYMAWSWSRDLRRKPGRKIALLDFHDGQLGLSDYPDIILSDEEAPPKNVKMFGVGEAVSDGIRVILIEARQPETGEVGLAVLDGKVMEYDAVPKKIEDPLASRAKPGVAVPLGTRARVVTMPMADPEWY